MSTMTCSRDWMIIKILHDYGEELCEMSNKNLEREAKKRDKHWDQFIIKDRIDESQRVHWQKGRKV